MLTFGFDEEIIPIPPNYNFAKWNWLSRTARARVAREHGFIGSDAEHYGWWVTFLINDGVNTGHFFMSPHPYGDTSHSTWIISMQDRENALYKGVSTNLLEAQEALKEDYLRYRIVTP